MNVLTKLNPNAGRMERINAPHWNRFVDAMAADTKPELLSGGKALAISPLGQDILIDADSTVEGYIYKVTHTKGPEALLFEDFPELLEQFREIDHIPWF